MKPKDFTPHRRIEREYATLIEKALGKHIDFDQPPYEVIKALTNLWKSPAVLEDIARRIAGRMVTQVRASNARSWREAAAKSSRGREIYQALRQEMQTGVGVRVGELVEQNARLIRSIPEDVREITNNEINAMAQAGERPETIAAFLRHRIPQITKNKARLIARTETSKASEALTQARSEDLGIHWYQWASVEDQRVRASHRLMDKVLVSYDDPPAPELLAHERSTLGKYNAGQAPNCRCTAFPVTSLDLISWPARVFRGGSIQRMNRGAFADMTGIGRTRAA